MMPSSHVSFVKEGHLATAWYQFLMGKAKAAGITPPAYDAVVYTSQGVPTVAWRLFFQELADAASAISGAKMILPASNISIVEPQSILTVPWRMSLMEITNIIV